MINREATIRWKGYDPDEIILHPSKKVWANCDKCGDGRWIALSDYCDLCHKCAMVLRSGKNHHFFGKYGNDHPRGGKPSWNRGLTKENNKSVKKISESNKGRYGTLNNNYNTKIDKFIEENVNKHLCGCGCGEFIKIIRQHYSSGIPKYIHNHWCKGEENPMYGKEQTLVSRIKSSCTHKNISIDDFDGFGGEYCYKFNDKLKNKIRNRYNNCDYISGLPDYICNILNGKLWKLDVHHVDYDKQQGCNGIKWILIPLSRSNHVKITGKLKPFWNKLFVYSLEYDKEYYKREDEKFNVFRGIITCFGQ